MSRMNKNTAEYHDYKELLDSGEISELSGYELSGKTEEIYKDITRKIVKVIRKGVAPWEAGLTNQYAGFPVNVKSKKSYNGVNILLLGMEDYDSRWWGTKQQFEDRDDEIKKR